MRAEVDGQNKFKDDILKEIEVHEVNIAKLTKRNETLEMLMKKAIKIMKNPMIMKEAFRSLNFDKFVYKASANGVELVE